MVLERQTVVARHAVGCHGVLSMGVDLEVPMISTVHFLESFWLLWMDAHQGDRKSVV